MTRHDIIAHVSIFLMANNTTGGEDKVCRATIVREGARAHRHQWYNLCISVQASACSKLKDCFPFKFFPF